MSDEPSSESNETNGPESRWLITFAMLVAGGMALALPDSLTIGPRWLLFALICILLVPAILTGHHRLTKLNMIIGHAISGLITLFMFISLVLLIRGLFAHAVSPGEVLRAGSMIWLTNILVFATWYWRLDAGGPHIRAHRYGHDEGSFLFPQMQMNDDEAVEKDGSPWSPKFIDYLFIAFNTSTAFSPTDCPVLSRWAKALAMIQSLLSLIVVLVLIGRAVNII